ncbi:MAG TPA: AbrB/MazE/SpoVT family DNA-binding domain-containing protein [Candidatus Thermoplasmatota archaeon]|nr:AbrB/MazE/SpoVT family DNA-binding domain-containing protein [Candidatus Thermoplasmatota archaeon]
MAETADDVEVTTMGEKGQVVIPKTIRDRLGLGNRAKFVVLGQGDTIVLKRLTVPDLEREFEQVVSAMKHKALGLTETDVEAEVKAHRAARRRRK